MRGHANKLTTILGELDPPGIEPVEVAAGLKASERSSMLRRITRGKALLTAVERAIGEAAAADQQRAEAASAPRPGRATA